jgi:aldehyde dehydrogenase (NAD+)
MAQTHTNQPYFKEKREFFDQGKTLSYSFRIEQLEKLKDALLKNEDNFYAAIHRDLHKPKMEAWFSEIGFTLAEVNHALRMLKRWMKPKRVSTPLVLEPGKSEVIYRPKGVCLIIAPWNYPIMLSFSPLVAAFAAGNTVVLKPSEEAPATAELIQEIISKTFPPELVSVVLGNGAEVVPALMREHTFNHVFFTGSTSVGAKIAEMAAPKLVSITLELGGKSPAIVDATCNLKVTAKRIIWGKLLNAGQSCVSPDYILVEPKIKEKLINELVSAIQEFLEGKPEESESYGRIINQRRFDELVSYLGEGKIRHGGSYNRDELFMEPTIMEVTDFDAGIMKNEIFGPILPILTFEDDDDILQKVRKNRYPLSAYYFGTNKKREAFILNRIEFGGASINNTAAHLGNPSLPFGGVQTSGLGSYHGEFGFKCFSNEQAVYKSATWIDPKIKYAPFNKFKLNILKKLMSL